MDTKTELGTNLAELFEALPLDHAMGSLLGDWEPRNEHAKELALGVAAPPQILAGIWLYVDDLDRSHTVSQNIETPTGSYWHAMMHRREGDFSNSKYWYRKAGHHQVIAALGYDPFSFVDECESDGGQNSPTLVEMQRREWKALFDWCLQEAKSGG